MARFIKFNKASRVGIKFNKVFPKVQMTTPAGGPPAAHAKLRAQGMTQRGINELFAGRSISDAKDRAIVAEITAAALS